jgi:hypothetical protein
VSSRPPLPPINLASAEPSPEPTRAAPTKATDDAGSDGLTNLVKLLIAAAVLLGLGGAIGLYATRSH